MIKVDLSIVIVTYNSEDVIGKCLESIYKTIKKNTFEVVLSDNSPSDGTKEFVEKLKSKYKNLTFIKNKENLGFSKANNVAVEKTSGEYVLFLNPDMEVYDNTLDGMVQFMRDHEDAGVAGCYVELINGKLDDSSHRGFPTPWNSLTYFSGLSKMFPKSKLFAGYNMTYLDTKKTHTVDAIAGSFMMMPRKVGEKLKWWDEDFFFYGEDLDFCYRITQLGYNIYFVSEFKALHYKGTASGIKSVSKDITKATRETRIKVTNWRFDAMRIFYDKHYKDKYPSFVRSLVFAAISAKKFLTLRSI